MDGPIVACEKSFPILIPVYIAGRQNCFVEILACSPDVIVRGVDADLAQTMKARSSRMDSAQAAMIMVVDSFHSSSAVPGTAHTLRLIIPLLFMREHSVYMKISRYQNGDT